RSILAAILSTLHDKRGYACAERGEIVLSLAPCRPPVAQRAMNACVHRAAAAEIDERQDRGEACRRYDYVRAIGCIGFPVAREVADQEFAQPHCRGERTFAAHDAAGLRDQHICQRTRAGETE